MNYGGPSSLWAVLIYITGLCLSLALNSSLILWAALGACVVLLLFVLTKEAAEAGEWFPFRLRENDDSGLFCAGSRFASRRFGGRVPAPGAALLLLFLFLGIFMGCLRLQLLERSFLAGLEGRQAVIDITVTGPAKQKGDKTTFVGHATGVQWQGNSAKVSEDILVESFCRQNCPAEFSALQEGSLVRVHAAISKPVSSPGSDFDYGLYLRRRGINVTLQAGSEHLQILPERRGGISGLVDRIRSHARASLRTGTWGDSESLLQGMVLGDGHVVPDAIISDFQASGLLHMLAVSGQNVVLLGFILLLLLRALLMPRLAATVIAAAAICLYVPLTGAGPSIVRAGIVGVLGMAALVFSRQSDRYHFLALSAAVILSINPYSLLDPGFQLSFAAVLAIFFISPLFSRWLHFLPSALREAVAISAATGLATAPITLADFHQVSLVTVPANVAAAPVAGPIMLLGVLAIMVKPVMPLASWALVSAASVCTGYLISVARFFASFPGAVYAGGSPGLILTFAFYGTLAGMVLLARNGILTGARRRLKLRPGIAVPVALLPVILILFGFACARGAPAVSPPDSFRVSFLDIGQGDASLIQVPPGESSPQGYAILIDGGPGSGVVDRLKESGVTRLDAVFMTHPDADHSAGLLPVLSSFPVSAVFDAAPPSSSGLYRDFLKLVEQKGISYNIARKGQILTFGGLMLKVLHPGDNMKENDSNANCIVLLASLDDLDILLPGDAEGEVLSTLNLTPMEVYKVPHHGSRDGAAAAVLNMIRPEVAVISVGEGNRYGHPTDQTLGAIKEAGARIFRTDRQGTVRVSYVDGNMVISTEK